MHDPQFPLTGEPEFIVPDWPAPPAVHAVVTTRQGGVSRGEYAGLNLAGHVGDDPVAVDHNRRILRDSLQLPAGPAWLTQVHGTTIVDAVEGMHAPEADGSIARTPGPVCAVLTADCLPVLLCDRKATRVGAVHAGWRGLAAGVLEAAVEAMATDAGEMLAWLGPAIGPEAYVVGEDVKAACLAADAGCEEAFSPAGIGRWHADLYGLAKRRLARCGIQSVFGGGLCTFSDSGRFFSYRRNRNCGRMASLAWLGP